MTQKQHILVTGGAGYIGSHICVALADSGYIPVIVDNLSNAHKAAIEGIAQLTGYTPPFYACDVSDRTALDNIFKAHNIKAIIHLAASKAVEESVQEPLSYYMNNMGGLMSVLAAMKEAGVKQFVYSSSATVYAPNDNHACSETDLTGPVNPYGWTKYMGEQVIRDMQRSGHLMAATLRYFNPVGAHQSGLISENPKGKPNNLMPLVVQVAQGMRSHITIYGDDYDTPDGTAIRDYIHVMDVAEAHVLAMQHIERGNDNILLNIGTGRGHSVLEIIKTYEKINEVTIPVQMGPRRAGDVANVCAETSQADKILGWRAGRSLEDMCRDAHQGAVNRRR